MHRTAQKNWFWGTVLTAGLLSSIFVAPIVADDFPEGDGKALIMRSCGNCHPTDQIARQRKTEDQWQATVVRMQGRGASVSSPEADVVIKYLAKNFLKVEDTSKINVNKADAKTIATLGFTPEEADKIVDYRDRKGEFKEWGDLLQIYGVSGAKVEAAKDKMTF
jgi:competence ComEA-like helix-hairpin-helix protein